jgi:hypothetical protein
MPAGWMEMKGLDYRDRFLSFIRAPKERFPPLGVWPRALTRVAAFRDISFEVLRSKPKLVPSEDTGGRETAEVPSEDTEEVRRQPKIPVFGRNGRKRGDESSYV